MGKYALNKAAHLLLVLVGVSILTFALTTWIQGNPADIVLGQTGIEPTHEEIALMEKRLGIDQSILVQYFAWVRDVLELDFGSSYITRKPVIEELAYRLPPTVTLTFVSFFLMLLLAVPIGILTVMKKDTWLDHGISAVTFTFMGIPGFVLGLVLAYFISVRLQLLPMVGNQTTAHWILPVVTLALPMACRYIRLIKANMLEVLDEDYIFLLRTKGLRESVIMFSNALKNAFIPIVNLMGISFGNLLGGSVIVESIFSWPGLGNYLMFSINNRDYPVILAYVLLMAAVFVIINFIVDMIVCLLDPRIPFDERRKQ